ncbi:MAG: cytochrome c, partial [bacterium]|nr:cytochrome c [bacterium]
LFFIFLVSASAQDKAEVAFKQNCAACHSIGKGRLVGPDLSDIHKLRTESWLLNFIKSSQTVIKSGDQTADSLFRAYNQILMPDQTTLSNGDIKDILIYIKSKSPEALSASSSATVEQSKEKSNNKSDVFFDSIILILLAVSFSFLIGVLFLYRKIKELSDEQMDYYSSDRAFFKSNKK